ncbi:hypothetical protein JW930_01665 [Candidatus Woesearchaeota archaeon]|nr:hypothetical protein [Candidatus Woesearchaeota archaeon]
MDSTKTKVNRVILQLAKEFGNIIPVVEIHRILPEIDTKKIHKAISDLQDEGLVSRIDKQTIQVNL